MKILAIESSHDDTSVVLFENKKIILDVSISQTDFHKMYGGTVPEFAARKHCDTFSLILDKFLHEHDLSDIDHVAYTNEPGLIGSLQMGRLFAYGIGFALDKPVKAINHMFAHIYAVSYDHEIKYPALALIVSGGHTQLWNVKSIDDIDLLGQTTDDAAGEVFDKIARKLDIGFPGGPTISKLAKQGKNNIDFKIKMTPTNIFSFSGLKTKVLNYIHNLRQKNETINAENIACSFEESIVNYLVTKTKFAFSQGNYNSVIIGGGVSANDLLREKFKSEFKSLALIPSKKFTTDNAAMIAIRSYLKES